MEPATGQTRDNAGLRVHSAVIRVRTAEPLQFIDLTERIRLEVAASGIRDGLVNVQTRHTTTALVINENEPLLLQDLAALLGRWAPADGRYWHDRFDLRVAGLEPGERVNGHAHARAVTLGASECLNLAGGELQLGRWQRVLLVELDGGRDRSVSVTIVGSGGARNGGGRPGASSGIGEGLPPWGAL